MAFIIAIALIYVVIRIVISGIKVDLHITSHKDTPQKEIKSTEIRTSQPPKENSIDTWNFPPTLTVDQQNEMRKVANFCGHRYVTQADIQKYSIYSMGKDLASVPGGDIWDTSIHNAAGQYDRMKRAVLDKGITILCYDPQYQLAKVQGTSSIYLTNGKRCSCPDYRKRHLPCKHMYALAVELDGNVNKLILDSNHDPLYGLTFALVGRLPRSHNGTGGIRADITERGGMWTDEISFENSAAVLGTNPSDARLQRVNDFDMETLSPESIINLFSLKQGEAIAEIPDSPFQVSECI